MNKKNCGCRNISIHKEIKGSDKYVNFGHLIIIGLITSRGFKAKVRPHKYKYKRYANVNVSKKDLSKIIKEFDKLPYESYDKKRPKHELTGSYFYPVRQPAKCITTTDVFLRGT